MTIWLLMLVLLAALAGLGYRQGVIRVAFSLLGIFVALFLAGPLSKPVTPALAAAGVKNPVLLWFAAPIAVFVIVLCIFKIIGMLVHFKATAYYTSRAGDLRRALWGRLSARLGLCLALVNGTVYLALIALGLYVLSYWTVQLATPDKTSRTVRILNRLGWDVQQTGLARVARAIDPLPEVYYDAADLAGLMFHHPLAEARLSRYPGLLSLGERQEFQDIARDASWMNMRLEDPSIQDVLNHPKAQVILKNPELLRQIWTALEPDLADLRAFLETGRSEKYDAEKILGRWVFDANGTAAAYRRAKPTVLSSEMQRMKTWFSTAYGRTVLVVTPDHLVFLKNVPSFKPQPAAAPAVELQTAQGQWRSVDGEYELSFSNGGDRKARFEGTRLFVTSDALALVFVKED